jgi:hypothetical protein
LCIFFTIATTSLDVVLPYSSYPEVRQKQQTKAYLHTGVQEEYAKGDVYVFKTHKMSKNQSGTVFPD